MSEQPGSIHTDDGGAACSRRTVLRAGGAAVGTVATAGVAGAQNGTETNGTATGETPTDGGETESRITTMAVTLEQEDIQSDLVGMWIHISRPVEPVQASVADQCDVVDWGNQDTLTYDAKLIDRRNEVYEQSIQIYLPRRAEVGGGDLVIINDEVSCQSGYVGIELEQIGARNVDAGIKPGEGLTETGAETGAEAAGGAQEPTGGAGPGFGLLAAVGGLLGAGRLLKRNDEG